MKFWRPREPFSGFSHALGALLALFGVASLLFWAGGKVWPTVAFAIYGVTLVTLYVASALYHWLRVSPRTLYWLQRFDHSAIYLLIAGSYTPFCLLVLPKVWGWSLLAIVWALALAGVALSFSWRGKPDWLRVTIYLVMGWLIVFALAPLRAHLPDSGMSWLVAGGVLYSVGTLVFALDRPHLWPGKFSAHDLWHLFVLGGSTCHFIVMARLVAVV